MQPTKMFSEAKSTARLVEQQYQLHKPLIDDIAAYIQAHQPKFVATCARGSSDHAAAYAKYLIETRCALPVLSYAPSIATLYQQQLALEQSLFIIISQSGRSPDIIQSAQDAKKSGALVLAIVNDQQSPAADIADLVLPIFAGKEESIAATKSYIMTLTTLVHLVAVLADDTRLRNSLQKLPSPLQQAWQANWSDAEATLIKCTNMFVVGRGMNFAIALEAALKFKETAAIHAEAFSFAEVRHGPMAIVKEGFPLLAFVENDQSYQDSIATIHDFTTRGAQIIQCGAPPNHNIITLPTTASNSSALAPILKIMSFYRLVNSVSIGRGINPDKPPYLRKITETL